MSICEHDHGSFHYKSLSCRQQKLLFFIEQQKYPIKRIHPLKIG
ncbi:hypothetical protein FORC066_1590 [Yersinia enterocolitica]|nr:hypothetical protein FORC066_1590 [Yersinia enterocolitica]